MRGVPPRAALFCEGHPSRCSLLRGTPSRSRAEGSFYARGAPSRSPAEGSFSHLLKTGHHQVEIRERRESDEVVAGSRRDHVPHDSGQRIPRVRAVAVVGRHVADDVHAQVRTPVEPHPPGAAGFILSMDDLEQRQRRHGAGEPHRAVVAAQHGVDVLPGGEADHARFDVAAVGCEQVAVVLRFFMRGDRPSRSPPPRTLLEPEAVVEEILRRGVRPEIGFRGGGKQPLHGPEERLWLRDPVFLAAITVAGSRGRPVAARGLRRVTACIRGAPRLAAELQERPVHGAKVLDDRRRRFGERALERGPREGRAQHAAHAVAQLVRLVHQQADTPERWRGEALEPDDGIEDVVVVAHHDIRPGCGIEAEFERAHGVACGDALDHLARGNARFEQRVARRTHAIVVAPGILTAGRIAGHVRIEADVPLGREDDGCGRCRLRFLVPVAIAGDATLERLRRRLLAGGARRQVDDAVERAIADGAQRREHRRRGLAAAGGGFHQQLFAVAKRPVGPAGEAPLAVPELGERERQPAETRVAPRDARRGPLKPRRVRRHSVREKPGQRVARFGLLEVRRRIVVRVQVDQAQPPCVTRLFPLVHQGRIQP